MAKGQTKTTAVEAKKVDKTKKPEAKESADEIKVVSSSESEESASESDVELSEESADEQDEVELKGLEDTNKHVVIKPSKNVTISSKDKAKRGVIYLGRIPDGFYEEEMKKYFAQFGDIARVKLSRNKKTGKSKHYGFIEFENKAVAKIASETMNNYLLYGHLVKCYVVEDTSKYDLIFSDKKFKIIPWKSISKSRNDRPKSQSHWDKLSKKFDDSKQKRAKALSQKGINVDYLA